MKDKTKGFKYGLTKGYYYIQTLFKSDERKIKSQTFVDSKKYQPFHKQQRF